jgi:hypothetical protein
VKYLHGVQDQGLRGGGGKLQSTTAAMSGVSGCKGGQGKLASTMVGILVRIAVVWTYQSSRRRPRQTVRMAVRMAVE